MRRGGAYLNDTERLKRLKRCIHFSLIIIIGLTIYQENIHFHGRE